MQNLLMEVINMIKIENAVLPNARQIEIIIKGMRNPLNSWNRIDTDVLNKTSLVDIELGDNDYDLMKRLTKAGKDHRKFMRMMNVYMDITAPLYWWKEFDTYKIGTTANSCSTMHKITAKEFTLNDFSCEHLEDFDEPFKKDNNGLTRFAWFKTSLESTIDILNYARELFLETKDKKYWWQIIQLLPSSYNQKRTVMLNYEVLSNMYHSRKNHKLDEWRDFCKWIETLPYSELITGDFK